MPYLASAPTYVSEVWDNDEYAYIQAVVFTTTQDLASVDANFALYLSGGIAAVPQVEKDAILTSMMDSYAAAVASGSIVRPTAPDDEPIFPDDLFDPQ
jgi:hypothetical protein